MNYWGGVLLGSGKCVCGVIRICVLLFKLCNCDLNNKVWREDSGFLIDKLIFLVFELRFGDMSVEYEKGYYIFGKLKCYNL